MTKPATKIKNIIESHLRGNMFGLNVWGNHEIATDNTLTLIDISAPSRFERYGCATVYHPTLGKWLCSLQTYKSMSAGAYVKGTPKQILTVEELTESLSKQRSMLQVLYRVYNVPVPPEKVILWDAYWHPNS